MKAPQKPPFVPSPFHVSSYRQAGSKGNCFVKPIQPPEGVAHPKEYNFGFHTSENGGHSVTVFLLPQHLREKGGFVNPLDFEQAHKSVEVALKPIKKQAGVKFTFMPSEEEDGSLTTPYLAITKSFEPKVSEKDAIAELVKVHAQVAEPFKRKLSLWKKTGVIGSASFTPAEPPKRPKEPSIFDVEAEFDEIFDKRQKELDGVYIRKNFFSTDGEFRKGLIHEKAADNVMALLDRAHPDVKGELRKSAQELASDALSRFLFAEKNLVEHMAANPPEKQSGHYALLGEKPEAIRAHQEQLLDKIRCKIAEIKLNYPEVTKKQ